MFSEIMLLLIMKGRYKKIKTILPVGLLILLNFTSTINGFNNRKAKFITINDNVDQESADVIGCARRCLREGKTCGGIELKYGQCRLLPCNMTETSMDGDAGYHRRYGICGELIHLLTVYQLNGDPLMHQRKITLCRK